MSENYINPFRQFSTNNKEEDVENVEGKKEQSGKVAIEIELEKLVAFNNQPFNEYTEDEMRNLKESIERIELQHPIIVRKKENDTYEILSGHNRVACFKELQRKTIPAFVVEADDDTAQLIMIDSNIVQRENLSVMERARAYKMKDEIRRRKKFNNDIVNENLSEEEQERIKEDERNKQYYRILNLNNLIEEYQHMCDNEELSINAGEQLSKLSMEQQKRIYEVLGRTKITEKKAEELRNLANENENLNIETIKECFLGKVKKDTIKNSIKFTKKEMEKYFSDCNSTEEIREKIILALDEMI